ncbi:MAG: cobalamin-independent methionine synthase II family protein [Chloroflexi bacterium]|nr:cobalamin-independent methionine synthase II family protein [Chloroflexota bacterium]
MKQSTDRILTTHTGSLPRAPGMLGLLVEEQQARLSERSQLEDSVRAAVRDVYNQQVEMGLDVVNDGEQGRVDYTVYVKDRLTGYEGENVPLGGMTSDEEFPELAELLKPFASPFQVRPMCVGPIDWMDWPAVEADIENLRAASSGAGAEEVFMTSPSPGQISRFLHNDYYPSDEAYIYALADAMKRQYNAIHEAGFLLQLDCPDLALGRHQLFSHLTLEEFRAVAEMHVEALNYSVADIPADRMRMHICWGSTLGPHHTDVPIIDVIDIVLKAKPCAVAFPGANPRHEHEWKVWRDSIKLPEGKVIIPGVIDSTSNFVEHPEVVCDRIVRYAGVVGRENLIAGADCGFGTFAGRLQVDSKIVWMKLASLVEGARMASEQLWD